MTTTEQPLEKMTAIQLRDFARREKLGITYLMDRKKEDLVKRIRAALEARERGE